VHGCFWHQHEGCRHARLPSTRSEFWADKFARNKARDTRDLARAQAEGWETLVIWECETADEDALRERLTGFLGPARQSMGK
jgi:DNA mismatch endonuclease (patch repair protein)